MPYTKEERKVYNKAYREDHKEERAEKKKAYREDHKEEIAAKKKIYNEKHKEEIAEKSKIYNQTHARKKSNTISQWKSYGIIGDLNYIYDEYYLPCKACWVCGHDFSKYIKCADHDHDITDKENFRQILCNKCNTMDNWKKHSEWV